MKIFPHYALYYHKSFYCHDKYKQQQICAIWRISHHAMNTASPKTNKGALASAVGKPRSRNILCDWVPGVCPYATFLHSVRIYFYGPLLNTKATWRLHKRKDLGETQSKAPIWHDSILRTIASSFLTNQHGIIINGLKMDYSRTRGSRC